MRINWEDCRDDFQPDGSWRDMYVLDTDVEDWNKLLAAIRDLPHQCDIAGDQQSLPDRIERDLFQNGLPKLLVIALDGKEINCHFFDESQIEFDLDPRDIHDQASLDRVLDFMELIAHSVAKRVILTPENGPDYCILSFDPLVGEWRYHQAS